MRWDRFFEDLEDQLASEWEAERAALDSEAERLRLSRLGLRDRLASLCGPGADELALDLCDGTVLRARVTAVGADWIGLDAVGALGGGGVVPIAAIASVGAAEAELLRSARAAAAPPTRALAERMTMGFVLRDIARRRIPASVRLLGGRTLSGTIDRAARDHLDVALHDAGAPRRADALAGVRLVPFAAIAWVRLDAAASVA